MKKRSYRFLSVIIGLLVFSVLYGSNSFIQNTAVIETTVETTGLLFVDDNGDPNISDILLSRKDRGRRRFQQDVEILIPFENAETFVNTAYGNIIHQRLDMTYPGRMIPINIYFTYSSCSSIEGRYGNGWQLNYNMRYVTNDENSNILIVRSDDRNDIFVSKNGEYSPTFGIQDKLEKTSSGYKLTTWSDSLNNNGDYLEYYFESDNHNYLTSLQDRNGNEVTFRYDKNNALTKITADNGHEISLIYLNDKLSKIINGTIILSYTYDEFGNLIHIDRNNAIRAEYEYSEECNKLSMIINPLWHRFKINYDDNYMVSSIVSDDNDVLHSFEYAINERITRHIDGEGNSFKFEYDTLDRLAEYTDPKGQYFYFTYNADYDLLKKTSSFGTIFQNQYDEFGFVTRTDYNNETLKYERESKFGKITSVTKQIEGEGTEFEYDLNGNMTKVEFNSNLEDQYSISFEHNDYGQVVSAVKYDGGEYNYSYNDKGQLSEITLPNDGIVRYTYDVLGNVESISDPKENSTDYYYDEAGRIIQVVNADSEGFNIEYDANGNIIRTVDEETVVNAFAYDRLGMFRSYRNGLGIERTYKYDLNGSMIEYTNGESERTKYNYDEIGKLADITYPLGGKREFTYDIFGRMLESKDPLGKISKYEYSNNFVKRIVDPLNLGYTYNFDDAGKLQITDPTSSNYYFSLTHFGEIAQFILPNSLKSDFEYDAEGRLISESNFRHPDKDYEYDSNGNLIEINTGDLFSEYYSYDLNSNVSEYTDPNGVKTEYKFNDLNKLSKITNSLGLSTELYYNSRDQIRLFTRPNGSYKFRYDEVYRISKIIDPRNKITALTYDGADRIISYKNRMGDSTTFEYDKNSRLIKSTDPAGSETEFEYDANANMTGYTDAENNEYALEYDELGRLIKLTDPLNNSSELSYNGIGQILNYADPNGKNYKLEYNDNHWLTKLSLPHSIESRRYIYSPKGVPNTIYTNGDKEYSFENSVLGEITKVTYPDGLFSEWNYDNVGQLLEFIDRAGNKEQYEYNGLGKLTKKITPDMNEINYKYDIGGNLWQVILHDGRILYYAFNSQDNLVEVNFLSNPISEYIYNDEEQITWFNDMNGIVYNILYNNTKRVSRIDAPDTYYGFDYTPTGKLAGYSRPDASLSFTYNALGLQEKTSTHDGFESHFSYDPNGNRIKTINFIGNEINYEYDHLDRLTKESIGINADNIYTYDDYNLLNINEYSGRTLAFEYDELGRVTRNNDSFGIDLNTEYDGIGNILKQNISNIPADFTYDEMSNLTEIKYSDEESMNCLYDDFRNLTIISDEFEKDYYYSYDGSNRLISLTNPINVKVYFERHFPDESAIYTIDPAGETIKTFYNSEGLITKILNPLGHRQLFEYNSSGQITKFKNENNAQTLYRYDGLGRLDKLIKATGAVYNFDFNHSRKTMTMTDPKGYDYEYKYDAFDNIRKITNPLDQFELYYINKAGNMTSHTDANGNAHRYNHDLQNKPILHINPIGGQYYFDYAEGTDNLTGFGRLKNTEKSALIESTYDESNRITSLNQHGQQKVTFTYGGYSRINDVHIDGVRLYQISYDLLDRLKVIQFSENNLASHYQFEYDKSSNLVIVDGANEIHTKLRRDKAGRITEFENSNASNIKLYPDPVGNIHKMIDNDYELNFVHNNDRKLVRVRYPDLNILDYTYDLNGNLIEMTNSGGSGERLVSLYNKINQSVTDTMNYSGIILKATSYRYDNAGNLSMLFDSDKDTSRFTYNGLGQLALFEADGQKINHRYNNFGDLTQTDYSNGLTSFYTHNEFGDLLTKGIMIDDTTYLMDLEYTYDDNGRLSIAKYDSVEMRYFYDDFGRISERWGPFDDTLRYTYNKFFGFETFRYNGQEISPIYDRKGRLTEFNGTLYSYDNSGRLAQIEAGTETTDLSYDNHGRLKTIESEDGRRTYLYSGLDDLIGIIRDEDLEFHLPFGLHRKHEEDYNSITYKVFTFRNVPMNKTINNPDFNLLNDQISFTEMTESGSNTYFAHNGRDNKVLKYSDMDSTEISRTLFSEFNEPVIWNNALSPNPVADDLYRDDLTGIYVNARKLHDPMLNSGFDTYRSKNILPEFDYHNIQILPKEIDMAYTMSHFGDDYNGDDYDYNYNTHDMENIPLDNVINGEKFLEEVYAITPQLKIKPQLINKVNPRSYAVESNFSIPDDVPKSPVVNDKWHNFSRFIHIDFIGRISISDKVLQRQSIDFNNATNWIHAMINESINIDYSKYETIINETFVKENPLVNFFVNRKADRVKLINNKIFSAFNEQDIPKNEVTPISINIFGKDYNIDIKKYYSRPLVFSKELFPESIGDQEIIKHNYLTLPVKPNLESILPIKFK